MKTKIGYWLFGEGKRNTNQQKVPAPASLRTTVLTLGSKGLVAVGVPLLLLLMVTSIALATATLTQAATGGGAISADTAVSGGNNTSATLGPITVTEGAAGDIGAGAAGTLVFQLPDGFQWDTASVPSVATSGTGCAGLTFGAVTFANKGGPLPNQVKFPITAVSTSACIATFGGTTPLKVKPNNATPLPAGGHIFLDASGAGINGLSAGSDGTNFGTIAEVAGAVSASVSTVIASPASVVVNGSSSATVTVTLRDAHGNGVSGKAVVLASGRGSVDTVTPASATTDASGVATFSVNSTISGSATLTATDTSDTLTITQTAVVTFTAGPVDRLVSTVIASPTMVSANGSATATVTVMLKDASSNVVSGKVVILSSSRGSLDTITPATVTSNTSGVATFTVTSTTSGTATFTATDTTDNITISQTAAVTFTVGLVDRFTSSVTASPTSVVANGSSRTTVTVTLRDADGSPVSGKVVILTSSRGSADVISPNSGSSNAQGIVAFTVTSTTEGTATFTAQDVSDSIILSETATVTFTAGGPGAPGPVLLAPSDQAQLSNLGPLLQWESPSATRWYQIQVIPFNNDGPGINLIIGDPLLVGSSQYQVKEPNFGATDANYVMLLGMTYTWRVRVATMITPPAEADWTAWSEVRSFRTAAKSSVTISRVAPQAGAVVSTRTPTLIWGNSDPTVFYYEVQVSKDAGFSMDVGAPMLYWELRHGGVTDPLNSYTISSQFRLEANTTYYWRVRPRVQGDGVQVAWSAVSSFRTP